MDALARFALPIATGLFDSIWQGALVALAVSLGLRALPRLGAASRYAIWLCALAALVAVPALTLVASTHRSEPAPAAATIASIPSAATAPLRVQTFARQTLPPVEAELPAPAAEPVSPRITVSAGLAFAVALLWALAAGWRGIALTSNLIELLRIRRDATMWSESHDYPVLLSQRVRVPIAIGFLRGAVILPAALVERLTAQAIQAIVVHEIAHLRRYDVWTNAFARIVEACVALNPVAWYVSHRIALEREIACDDWVVARLDAGEVFARTLAGLVADVRVRAPLAAPSALGS